MFGEGGHESLEKPAQPTNEIQLPHAEHLA
jgi:hypothetical protein